MMIDWSNISCKHSNVIVRRIIDECAVIDYKDLGVTALVDGFTGLPVLKELSNDRFLIN